MQGISSLPYLMNLFNNSTWMVDQNTLETIGSVLQTKINTGSVKEFMELINDPRPSFIEEQVVNDYAILPIEGTLVANATALDAMCGFHSTFALTEKFNELSANESINTIVLYIGSGGGEVTGGFEFAEAINNSPKRVIAFSDTIMASLAYLIGAAADEIIVTPSTEVGSIGVRTSIMKLKEDNKADRITFQAGSKKAYGDPTIPITDEEREFFQNRVDKLMDKFVMAVSKFRDWSEAEIRATEASLNKVMLTESDSKFFDKVMTRETFKERILNGTL